MSLLLQVSDPHFGTEQPGAVEALVTLAREHAPDVLVLSGDVTQRARRGQFDAARRFVDRVAAPRVLVVPGNHDIPLYNVIARVFRPYGGYVRVFGKDLEPIVDTPHWRVIGVNTTRARRHVDGEVSGAQVARVTARLHEADRRQLRVVVVHQPVRVVRASDEANLLHGRERAIRAWVAAGVDLVLGGHIHLPYVRQLDDVAPALPRVAWTVQAGTAVSTRTRDGVPNSVNLLHWTPDDRGRACRVEQWDYAEQERRFVCRATHMLRFSAVPSPPERRCDHDRDAGEDLEARADGRR